MQHLELTDNSMYAVPFNPTCIFDIASSVILKKVWTGVSFMDVNWGKVNL